MSSGEGAILLVALPLAAAALAVAIPVAAVYGAVKGGQALYEAHQRAAEERRRIAEAAEIAKQKQTFEQESERIRKLGKEASSLEVAAPPARSWNDTATLLEVRLLNAQLQDDIAQLEDDIAKAKAELARQKARLAGEMKRRATLDSHADALRIPQAQALVAGSTATPSIAKMSADAAQSSNDAYARTLKEEQAALDVVLAQLAQANGRRNRLIHEAGKEGASYLGMGELIAYPELSCRQEAQRQLDSVRQDRAKVKEALDDVFRDQAAQYANEVMRQTLPEWTEEELSRDNEPWRKSLRSQLQSAQADWPAEGPLPPSVGQALGLLETADIESDARPMVNQAIKDCESAVIRHKQIQQVIDQATTLAEAAASIRSATLARRCEEVLADVKAHDSAWDDTELNEYINVRIPALTAKIAEDTQAEQRNEEYRKQKRVKETTARAINYARDKIQDSPSWQIIELEHPDRYFDPRDYVAGFMARQTGDMTSTILVRATTDGKVETVDMNIKTKSGLPSKEAQVSNCAEMTSAMENFIEPYIQESLPPDFAINMTFDTSSRGVYRPTDKELDSMMEFDEAAVSQGDEFDRIKLRTMQL